MTKVLFGGWDEIIKSHRWLKGHRDVLFATDPWRPSFIVWVSADYQDRISSELAKAIKLWTNVQCQDRRWRHTFAGVYEFDSEDDAKIFAEKWANHAGDTDPLHEDTFMC